MIYQEELLMLKLIKYILSSAVKAKAKARSALMVKRVEAGRILNLAAREVQSADAEARESTIANLAHIPSMESTIASLTRIPSTIASLTRIPSIIASLTRIPSTTASRIPILSTIASLTHILSTASTIASRIPIQDVARVVEARAVKVNRVKDQTDPFLIVQSQIVQDQFVQGQIAQGLIDLAQQSHLHTNQGSRQ